MVFDIIVGIVVAIITVGGSYAYQNISQSPAMPVHKESYKGSLFSALNKSLQKLKGTERLKSTASAGLKSPTNSNAGQNLNVDELKKELKKEFEEEFKDQASFRSVSEEKSKDNVGEAVEAIKTSREEVQDVEHQNQDEEPETQYDESETQDEEDEDDIDLDLENISIDEEDRGEEELNLNEDRREDQSDSEDEDWIEELSRDIEKGTEEKVDLQRDLKNDQFSVEELEKELENSNKKLKDFAR